MLVMRLMPCQPKPSHVMRCSAVRPFEIEIEIPSIPCEHVPESVRRRVTAVLASKAMASSCLRKIFANIPEPCCCWTNIPDTCCWTLLLDGERW
jgi:hypothetical protein